MQPIVQVSETMVKSPHSLPTTRPEILPGLALSPLTLAGYNGRRIGSDSQPLSLGEEAPAENPLPIQPFVGAAPEEGEITT